MATTPFESAVAMDKSVHAGDTKHCWLPWFDWLPCTTLRELSGNWELERPLWLFTGGILSISLFNDFSLDASSPSSQMIFRSALRTRSSLIWFFLRALLNTSGMILLWCRSIWLVATWSWRALCLARMKSGEMTRMQRRLLSRDVISCSTKAVKWKRKDEVEKIASTKNSKFKIQ